GLLLSSLFHRQVERDLGHDLQILLDTLLFITDVSPDGGITLSRKLSDSKFDQPNSGRYWQILVDGRAERRSPSLGERGLRLEAAPRQGGLAQSVIDGPFGERLLVVELDLTL